MCIRDSDWEQRENPCHISYYTGDRFAARNIINTSLGIMAKQGADNQYVVCVSDLDVYKRQCTGRKNV